MPRKPINKYYFSVEGETEKWYLDWLKEQINLSEKAECNVAFDAKIQKDPLKRAKSVTITKKTEIWHLSDYESDETVHREQFFKTMDRMKEAEGIGKMIQYEFGYSNFTFDLWIILHKANCNSTMAHRKNYLTPLNRAYGENFESMDEYKHENNFKRCLSQLQLSDVIKAIERAKKIMQKNQENGYVLKEYKGYQYYEENPSLNIWKIIEKILKDCELMD